MLISIDDEMKNYLKALLKNEKWWCAVKILGIIDKAEKKENEICNHKFGKYVGEKECCVHCGKYDVNMGENWTLKK